MKNNELQNLFNELEAVAYNIESHTYEYKKANQIIRKHVEAMLVDIKSGCTCKQDHGTMQVEVCNICGGLVE